MENKIDIQMLDARGAEGVKGHVVFNGKDLIVRTPKNPNNVLRPREGACGGMVAGVWAFEFYVFMFNAVPSEEERNYYAEQLDNGKTLYDVVKHMMGKPKYTDYRFCNGMRNEDWINRMFCLFFGLNFEVASPSKAEWYSYVINRSRDCVFIELLKSQPARIILELGAGTEKSDLLWTDNKLKVPGCMCDSIDIPIIQENYNPRTFELAGTYSVDVPANVNTLTVVVVGGGGTGADSAGEECKFSRQGAGGGQAGEVVVRREIPVTVGQKVDIRVGAGGKTKQIPYNTTGHPANGEQSFVKIGAATVTARGGASGIGRIGGGNTESGGYNQLQGQGGVGGSNSLAAGGAGGKVGFAGDDWAAASGANGAAPGGGGGGAGADDMAEAFPGGDGADGAVYIYFNGYKFRYLEQSAHPTTAGQNAKKYVK